MFALNRDEKKAILVIFTFACIGLCTRFAAKMSADVRSHIAIERSIRQLNANQITLQDIVRARALPRKVAESFIAYRTEQGPFRDIEDFKNVPGIGDVRFQKLKDIFYVD